MVISTSVFQTIHLKGDGAALAISDFFWNQSCTQNDPGLALVVTLSAISKAPKRVLELLSQLYQV